MFGDFHPPQQFHSHMATTPLPNKGLQILMYTRQSWPLSSEGSLACHTYCDTGNMFNIWSLKTPDTHTCCRPYGAGFVTTWSVTIRDQTPISCMQGE